VLAILALRWRIRIVLQSLVMTGNALPQPPQLLPYHGAIVAYLQSEEPALWKWYASTSKREEQAEVVRLDLLKTTYRLEAESQPRLYELGNELRERLQLSCEITLYQAQQGNGLNAALAYLPGQAHVILTGPLTSVLSEQEMRAVLAHELAHFKLLDESERAQLIAADLLRALSVDPLASSAASESLRLLSLWTEIYADRWACDVCADVMTAIAALLKTSTGVGEVHPESYLRQAEEIFAKTTVQTEQLSHPEPYIRARALRLWTEQGEAAHAEIQQMIEGGLDLQRLDLLAQKQTAHLTRQFLQLLLEPRWFQTGPVLAHAKQFFADFSIEEKPGECALKTALANGAPSLRDYFCYVMLDFVTVDRDLGEVALARAILLAQRLEIGERFQELAQKELVLGKKAFAKILRESESIVAKTELTLQS
jgi:Zn-dependent protease with chaperone function